VNREKEEKKNSGRPCLSGSVGRARPEPGRGQWQRSHRALDEQKEGVEKEKGAANGGDQRAAGPDRNPRSANRCRADKKNGNAVGREGGEGKGRRGNPWKECRLLEDGTESARGKKT